MDAVISLRPVDQFAIEGKTAEVTFECFASGRFVIKSCNWKTNNYKTILC